MANDTVYYIRYIYIYTHTQIYIYLSISIYLYIYTYIYILYICIYTMGPGPGLGLVTHVLWRYCMRLASSGVDGVRRVRLALLYVGSGVGVLWMMHDDVLDAASIMRCVGGVHRASGAVRRLAAPAAHRQHLMTLAACNTATRHAPPALALAP